MIPSQPMEITHPDPDSLDCLTCGSCCRSGNGGTLLISEQDLLNWKSTGRGDIAEKVQPGHFGMQAFQTDAKGACVHLGTSENKNACQIYPVRGTTCREFEKGSWQCLDFRKQFLQNTD